MLLRCRHERPHDPAIATDLSGLGDPVIGPRLPFLLPWVRIALLIRSIRATTWDDGHVADGQDAAGPRSRHAPPDQSRGLVELAPPPSRRRRRASQKIATCKTLRASWIRSLASPSTCLAVSRCATDWFMSSLELLTNQRDCWTASLLSCSTAGPGCIRGAGERQAWLDVKRCARR